MPTKRGWACIKAVEAIFANLEWRSAAVVGAGRMELLRTDLDPLVCTLGDGAPPRRLRPVW